MRASWGLVFVLACSGVPGSSPSGSGGAGGSTSQATNGSSTTGGGDMSSTSSSESSSGAGGTSATTGGGGSGSCVKLGGPVECDPLAGECGAAGSACDLGFQNGTLIGTNCFAPPNEAKEGEACDNGAMSGPFCAAGLRCTDDMVCRKFCCSDADCGGAAGACKDGGWGQTVPGLQGLGVCSKQ